MATPDKDKPETIDINPKLDWTLAKKHLDDVEAYLRTFAGKMGHNPFMAIREKITPLRNRLASKNFSDKDNNLYKDIMSLEKKEPTVIQHNEVRLPQPVIRTPNQQREGGVIIVPLK